MNIDILNAHCGFGSLPEPRLSEGRQTVIAHYGLVRFWRFEATRSGRIGCVASSNAPVHLQIWPVACRLPCALPVRTWCLPVVGRAEISAYPGAGTGRRRCAIRLSHSPDRRRLVRASLGFAIGIAITPAGRLRLSNADGTLVSSISDLGSDETTR